MAVVWVWPKSIRVALGTRSLRRIGTVGKTDGLEEVAGVRKSGLLCLDRCPRDPHTDKWEKTEGWVDEKPTSELMEHIQNRKSQILPLKAAVWSQTSLLHLCSTSASCFSVGASSEAPGFPK